MPIEDILLMSDLITYIFETIRYEKDLNPHYKNDYLTLKIDSISDDSSYYHPSNNSITITLFSIYSRVFALSKGLGKINDRDILYTVLLDILSHEIFHSNQFINMRLKKEENYMLIEHPVIYKSYCFIVKNRKHFEELFNIQIIDDALLYNIYRVRNPNVEFNSDGYLLCNNIDIVINTILGLTNQDTQILDNIPFIYNVLLDKFMTVYLRIKSMDDVLLYIDRIKYATDTNIYYGSLLQFLQTTNSHITIGDDEGKISICKHDSNTYEILIYIHTYINPGDNIVIKEPIKILNNIDVNNKK